MTDKHLAKLKADLVKAERFADVYTYFFDHLGEDPAFLDRGRREENAFLKAVLPHVAEELLHKPVKMVDFLAIRLEDQPFLHGSCQFAGHLMTFFYFEDIAKGLAAVVSILNPKETHFIRFSGQRLTPPAEPSRN